MSVDTTVVILGRESMNINIGREYTAAVIQAAENLEDKDQKFAVEKARAWMNSPFFSQLGRAKQFARLLQEEMGEMGWLEYDHLPMYFVDDAGVWPLTKKGKIKPQHLARWRQAHPFDDDEYADIVPPLDPMDPQIVHQRVNA